jgi:hypothetical protein
MNDSLNTDCSPTASRNQGVAGGGDIMTTLLGSTDTLSSLMSTYATLMECSCGRLGACELF